MINYLKNIVIITIALFCLLAAKSVNAQILISNIQISSPDNGQAVVTWNTNQPSQTEVYFGTQNNQLDKRLGNIEFKISHRADLTGLKKKTDYYYKIIATDNSGQRAESFVQYFNTKDMKDSVAPKINGLRLIQATDVAAVIYFLTDEPSRVDLNYGTSLDKLDKRKSNNSLRYDHLIILTGLTPGSKYYFNVVAKDDDGNLAERSDDFSTDVYNNYDQIKIINLVPENIDQAPLLPERAAVSWDSNILATSEIIYGIKPTDLSSRAKVSVTHQLSHRAELINLKPDTVYYFKIKMASDLNRKNFESQVYSLKTAPLTNDYLRQHFQSGNILNYRSGYYYLYNNYTIKLNNNSLDSRGYNKKVAKTIEEKYFNYYQEGQPYWGAYHDGQVVKSADRSTVYVIDGQYKRPIANWLVFKYLNYKASDIIIDRDRALNNYRAGDLIKHSNQLTNGCPLSNYSLAKSPNGGTVYLIANGRKLPFVNQVIFTHLGFKFSQVKIIDWGILGKIPDGQPII
jgi:hypothetical protein